MLKRIKIRVEDVLLPVKGGYNLYFKASMPTIDTDYAKSAEQILAYTEEIKREMEAKLSSIDSTINRIIGQIEKIREVIE